VSDNSDAAPLDPYAVPEAPQEPPPDPNPYRMPPLRQKEAQDLVDRMFITLKQTETLPPEKRAVVLTNGVMTWFGRRAIHPDPEAAERERVLRHLYALVTEVSGYVHIHGPLPIAAHQALEELESFVRMERALGPWTASGRPVPEITRKMPGAPHVVRPGSPNPEPARVFDDLTDDYANERKVNR
jgi:hypothetical protein